MNEDTEKALKEFYEKLKECQKDIPTEFLEFLEENLWDLLG